MGAYVVVEPANPVLTMVATGSEVGPTVEAAKKLTESGIATRVVSMPCQEVFLEQASSYQQVVLPGHLPTLSIEASAVHGWHRFSHAQIGMTSFGMSGAGDAVFAHFGFTPENIASKGGALVEFYKQRTRSDLTIAVFVSSMVKKINSIKCKFTNTLHSKVKSLHCTARCVN
jgi:transketolase